jgi:hypothetical protein
MIFEPIIYEDTNGQEQVMGLKQYIREMIPTVRFWLMLKLKKQWDKQYNRELKKISEFVSGNLTGGDDKTRNFQTKEIIARMERGAWNTMPAPFLQGLGIPRVQRF